MMLRVIPLLVKMHTKSRMEYRGAFFVDRAAQIAAYAAVFATLWVLLDRFGTLGGWEWPEMALLFAFQLLAYSLGASLSFVQFRDLETLVRNGAFDVLMVKPMSPWAYLTFSGLNVDYVGHIALAVGVMGWALWQADIAWSVPQLAFLIAALASATLVVAATMTMIGASSLVLVQSSYLYAIFFGFWELTRYPLNIFPPFLQWMMVTIVPLGFMNYVPVAAFLGKEVAPLGVWGAPLALTAGPLFAALAALHWRWCLRRYQSGGG
jgi:ABC-2 type transport system permease protein